MDNTISCFTSFGVCEEGMYDFWFLNQNAHLIFSVYYDVQRRTIFTMTHSWCFNFFWFLVHCCIFWRREKTWEFFCAMHTFKQKSKLNCSIMESSSHFQVPFWLRFRIFRSSIMSAVIGPKKNCCKTVLTISKSVSILSRFTAHCSQAHDLGSRPSVAGITPKSSFSQIAREWTGVTGEHLSRVATLR